MLRAKAAHVPEYRDIAHATLANFGLAEPGKDTAADKSVRRFYSKVGLQPRPLSILEEIARLKSQHQIDWYLSHLEMEKPPAKALERAHHAADVRRRQLRGEIA